MSPRTDSRQSPSTPLALEKQFREIVIGNGRAQEPYIIAFHYASDNVSGASLGTLFGFFEVEVHDQDAAYIVNFLASVAKKEYFANPRRDSAESFEAALHKINVALAEIVKHGNVSWLGHLHGAIGAVNQSTLHFSVTGEGTLYLAREGTFRAISTDLTDTDSQPHPLKTFTEVSSGELFNADLVFALSPSVWSLFSPEDLSRSLQRLGPTGFEQFLRTALINELSVAAVALFTCAASVEQTIAAKTKVSRQKVPSPLRNVWSDAPFIAVTASKQATVPTPEVSSRERQKEEYTDKKTGHIYVQAVSDTGFDPVDNPWKERWTLIRHDWETRTHSWNAAFRKIARRTRKGSGLAAASLSAWAGRLGRSTQRRARSLRRTIAAAREKQLLEKEQATLRDTAPNTQQLETEHIQQPRVRAVTPLTITLPSDALTKTTNQSSERVRRFFQRGTHPPVTMQDSDSIEQEAHEGRRSRLEYLSRWLRVTLVNTGQYTSRTGRALLSLTNRGRTFWATSAPGLRWTILGIILIVLGSAGYWILMPGEAMPPTETLATETLPTPSTATFPPTNEPQAMLLSDSRTVSTLSVEARAFASINNTLFLVTEQSIINLATNESTPTPEPIRLATAMDDLDAIFVLGTSDTLYSYSITTKQFTRNTLPIPANTRIDRIGAYLTYLYILDQGAGTMYRFPRAEGGFGTPVNWLKETVALASEGSMAVFENVALTLRNKEPALYSRGVRSTVTLGSTKTLVTADALSFDSKTGDLFVLDRANRRIVRWSTSGTLLAQYFHSTLDDTRAFTVSPDGAEILTAEPNTVTAWRIP